MNILAIDFGRRTGWAKERAGELSHGVVVLGPPKKRGDVATEVGGDRYKAFAGWLATNADDINAIVCEKARSPPPPLPV